MNWFIGLLVVGVGVLIVIKTKWIYDFTGPIDWAEQHLGSSGGTMLFIKLIGVLLIIGTLLAATGILGDMIRGIFGSTMKSF